MVAGDLHRQGVGRFLLIGRLYELSKHPIAKLVFINTSQHSRGFFEREGFVVKAETLDGYAPGLHRYDLELTLPDRQRNVIAERWISISGEIRE